MQVDRVTSRFVCIFLTGVVAVATGCASPETNPTGVDRWELISCASDEDCPSGSCLASGVCGLACETNDGCPGFKPWSCGNVGSERQCICNPKATDVCNGADDDCNGVVDDGANACVVGSVCEAGECVCSEQNTCNGECVDLATDAAHCGGCGQACAPGASCDDGTCFCAGVMCGNVCADLQSDGNNCGTCGTLCGSLGECALGGCQTIDNEWARWTQSGVRFEAVEIYEEGKGTGRYDSRDLDTGLTWEKSVPHGVDDLFQWDEAAKRCDELRGQRPLVGEPSVRRWRLPTRMELLSIVEYSLNNPALSDQFPDSFFNSAPFWSSTRSASDSSRVWSVNFKDGRAETQFDQAAFRVRCVK